MRTRDHAANLTKSYVDRLQAEPKFRIVWDAELPGFGVGVYPTGRKSYVVQLDMVIDGRKVTRRLALGSVGAYDTPADARRVARTKLQQMREGTDPAAKRRVDEEAGRTLNEVLLAYFKKSNLRPVTVVDYRSSVNVHLSDWLGRPIRAITPDMVEKRFQKITETVAARGKSSGQATANATMRVLRLLWNFQADRDPSLPACPVRRLKKQWHANARRDSMIRFTDLGAFYRAVCALSDTTLRDYLLLMLFTGLRRKEAATLRWTEVDLEEKVIRLAATRTKAKRPLHLPMSDLVYDLLNDRRKTGIASNGYVFAADSKTGHVAEPRYAIQRAAKAAGIVTTAGRLPMVHDLRRTFINVAERTAIPVYAMKALVNHSLDTGGSDVTAGYLSFDAERLREPAQQVADTFKALIFATDTKANNADAEVPWLAELLEEAEEPMPA